MQRAQKAIATLPCKPSCSHRWGLTRKTHLPEECEGYSHESVATGAVYGQSHRLKQLVNKTIFEAVGYWVRNRSGAPHLVSNANHAARSGDFLRPCRALCKFLRFRGTSRMYRRKPNAYKDGVRIA
jgi:hypothetical protein